MKTGRKAEVLGENSALLKLQTAQPAMESNRHQSQQKALRALSFTATTMQKIV